MRFDGGNGREDAIGGEVGGLREIGLGFRIGDPRGERTRREETGEGGGNGERNKKGGKKQEGEAREGNYSVRASDKHVEGRRVPNNTTNTPKWLP